MNEAPARRASPGRWPEAILLVIGFTLLAAWSKNALEARVYQTRETERLERLFRASALDPGRPSITRLEAHLSGLVGRIEIPRIGLSAIVAEGIHPRTLARAVGHVPRTAFPGEGGNVALAGHRDTFLRGLRRIRPDDVIRLRTPDGVFQYRVVAARVVGPERVDLLEPTRDPTLTLVTCYPFRAIGPAPRRYVVRAVQVRAPAPRQRAEGEKSADGNTPAGLRRDAGIGS